MSIQEKTREATLDVENVGGIDESSITFTPGVTVLVGRNATNRTSFLQALMAALGSDNASIKGDANEARVELTIGDDQYTRTLKRNHGTVVATGEPYLEDATVAELFSFLLESNDVRQAVAMNADLREFIMQPVDTEEIQEEIEALVQERQSVESEIQEVESVKGDLPQLEAERTRLRNEIDEKRDKLAAKEAELEAADTDIEQTQQEKQTLEAKLETLRELRSKLDDVRYDIETERATLDNLQTEKNELESTRETLPEGPMEELDELESQIERLRTQKQNIEPQVTELQSIISFNEDLLNTDEHEVQQVLRDDEEDAITDQLVADADVTCWTCGTTVPQNQIETTIDGLRELRQQKLSAVSDLEDTLDDLTAKRKELEEQQRERDRVENRLSTIETEIDESEATLASLKETRDDLTTEIEAVEAEVEDLEAESHSEILQLHREANQIEYDIGKLEGELERVEADITEIESRLDDLEDLRTKRTSLRDEIQALRTRIDRIEEEAVEAFNEHMNTVLDLLGYANLERIWIERVEKEVREGRQKVTRNAFHLHVIRSTASGTTYEDTIDHLSESEREVTALIFALAGYLTHDVVQEVPFMLLDSLEAIDSDRIAALIDYLSEHTEFLVAALLPEDAAALDTRHDEITPTDF